MDLQRKLAKVATHFQEKSAQTELKDLGASFPTLWKDFFDFFQSVVVSSKTTPEWFTECRSVKDIYRMSYNNPREFAILQTMLTTMHQTQTMKEIIAHQDQNKKEIIQLLSLLSSGESSSPDKTYPEGNSSVVLKEIETLLNIISIDEYTLTALRNMLALIEKKQRPAQTQSLE